MTPEQELSSILNFGISERTDVPARRPPIKVTQGRLNAKEALRHTQDPWFRSANEERTRQATKGVSRIIEMAITRFKPPAPKRLIHQQVPERLRRVQNACAKIYRLRLQ